MHDCNRRRERNLSTISIHSVAQNIRRYTEGRCNYPDRVFMWKQWYESSFPIVLDSNEELLRKQHDIKTEAVLLVIAGGGPTLGSPSAPQTEEAFAEIGIFPPPFRPQARSQTSSQDKAGQMV